MSIRTFGSADTPEVVDKDHIAAIHRVDSNAAGDFHVKVVKKISSAGRACRLGCLRDARILHLIFVR